MYDSAYDSTAYQSTASSAEVAALMSGIIIVTLIFAVIFYIVYAVFLGMIFKKAGIESWKAWVPIYNTWVLLEMGGQQGWLSLLSLVPGGSIVTAIFMYIAMYHIAIKFGKDATLFIVLAILVPIVWVIWLAVDKTAVWQESTGNKKVAA